MCNSTGSPIFSDFKSELSRAARFLTAGQGGRRRWLRGTLPYRVVDYNTWFEFYYGSIWKRSVQCLWLVTKQTSNSQRTYFPLESLNFLQIILQSCMSCRTCSNSASCCLFSFWKKVNLFFILFVVSSLIQFLNASSLSFSFSINKSCCCCASRNLLSKPRIFSRHSVPSSPFFATFCQLCTSVRICT